MPARRSYFYSRHVAFDVQSDADALVIAVSVFDGADITYYSFSEQIENEFLLFLLSSS